MIARAVSAVRSLLDRGRAQRALRLEQLNADLDARLAARRAQREAHRQRALTAAATKRRQAHVGLRR